MGRLSSYLLCSKNLCSGVGARKELKEFVKQNGVKQDNLCLTTSSGEGEAKKELAEFVEQNDVKQYQCTICGKAYLTNNSFGVHASRRRRGSGRPRDLLNYVVKNEVAAAFNEGSMPGTLPSNSKENPTPGFVFPSFERMQDAIKEWSDANFSPLTRGPRNITEVQKNLHSFHCPNALVKAKSISAG